MPSEILDAASYTIYRALVFCRNYSGQADASLKLIHELMDSLHEIPQILSAWGTYSNDADKLRRYFGYFQHERWKDHSPHFTPPDLVGIFDDALGNP